MESRVHAEPLESMPFGQAPYCSAAPERGSGSGFRVPGVGEDVAVQPMLRKPPMRGALTPHRLEACATTHPSRSSRWHRHPACGHRLSCYEKASPRGVPPEPETRNRQETGPGPNGIDLSPARRPRRPGRPPEGGTPNRFRAVWSPAFTRNRLSQCHSARPLTARLPLSGEAGPGSGCRGLEKT